MTERRTKKTFSRREHVQFGVVTAAAVGVSAGLSIFRPVGRDLRMMPVVARILQDDEAAVGGNPDGDVTSVAYIDHQCPACRLANGELQSVLASGPGIRLIFKDWPIFGELSPQAARGAIASEEQGLYARLHDLLMRGPGRVERDAVMSAVHCSGRRLGKAPMSAPADRTEDRPYAFAPPVRGFRTRSQRNPGILDRHGPREWFSERDRVSESRSSTPGGGGELRFGMRKPNKPAQRHFVTGNMP